MALIKHEMLQAARDYRRLAQAAKALLQNGLASLDLTYPDLKTQADAQFAPAFTDLDALVARINTIMAGITVSAADKTAFADKYEAEYRNNP